MQKVSKQSLAMLALSILLAISIALTFTFAALQDSKTATGKITFSGNATVVWAGIELGGSVSESSISFALDNSHFDFTKDGATTKATLSAGAKTAMEGITVTISNSATTTLNWSITLTTPGTDATVTLKSGLSGTLNKTSGDSNNGVVTKKLSDIIESIVIANADNFTTEASFVITAQIGA